MEEGEDQGKYLKNKTNILFLATNKGKKVSKESNSPFAFFKTERREKRRGSR